MKTHYLKVWSFNPNDIPHYLIPFGSRNAGFYPIHSDGQFDARAMVMEDHNKVPQWLACSTFPGKFYVCKFDEIALQDKHLAQLKSKSLVFKKHGMPPSQLTETIAALEKLISMRKEEKKATPRTRDDGRKRAAGALPNKDNLVEALLNDPSNPYSNYSDMDVLSCLIDDFIDMFFEATSLLLQKMPFEKYHVDSRLVDPNDPKKTPKSSSVSYFHTNRSAIKNCLGCEFLGM